ncbi:hypothetical protein HYU96_00415 [Candidatus Daviesbacteria bacterium]|nr:hypothetical protein [Candidatus Daviesbacteria bacterium]
MPQNAKIIIFTTFLSILIVILVTRIINKQFQNGEVEVTSELSSPFFEEVNFPQNEARWDKVEKENESLRKVCEENGAVWTQGYGSFEGKCTKKQIVDKCEKSGGVWMQGPFGEGPFCNKKYSDGGKSCTDSSQCLSKQCIIRKEERMSREGKCADWQVNYGCYGLLKRGRITNDACRD